MLIPSITETFGRKIAEEEEVMMNLADMLMQVYVAESTLYRVNRLEKIKPENEMIVYRDILDILMHDVAAIVQKSGWDAVVSYASPEQQSLFREALYQHCQTTGFNVKEARRRIANKLIEDNAYRF
jgi:hypothetical protein